MRTGELERMIGLYNNLIVEFITTLAKGEPENIKSARDVLVETAKVISTSFLTGKFE